MGDAELLLRAYLPVHVVALALVGGPLGVAAFKRKHGFDPTVAEDPDPLTELGERYRDVFFALVFVVTLAWAVAPGLNAWLGPVRVLERPAVRVAGVAVLVASLVWIRVAQLQLASAWRYGIDRARPPDEIVTTGLYRVSRNPIYVGLLATGVGFFLALPNAVTLAVAVATLVLLETRVRVEEEFLGRVGGAEYAAYRARTPRWLFRLGPG